MAGFSRGDCIDSLQRAAEELGHSPTVPEYRGLGIPPSVKTHSNKFGSWNDAKRAAGLDVTPRGENEDFVEQREVMAEKMKKLPAHFYMNEHGYEYWSTQHGGHVDHVSVSRLAAVAWYGFDVVCEKDDIHHRDPEGRGRPGVPWDNREEVIIPLSRKEHRRLHG